MREHEHRWRPSGIPPYYRCRDCAAWGRSTVADPSHPTAPTIRVCPGPPRTAKNPEPDTTPDVVDVFDGARRDPYGGSDA